MKRSYQKAGKERKVLRCVKAFFRRPSVGTDSPVFFSWEGSLTVETACVFPLFLWASVLALYLTAAVSMETHLAIGLHDTGKSLAVLACARDKGAETGLVEGSLSAVYAKSSILKKADIQDNPLYKTAVFSTMGSDFRRPEIIDVRLTTKIKMPVPIFSIKAWKLSQRARVRAWTGSVFGEQSGAGGEGQEEMVYVAATGTVYHRDRNCTHIKLSIQEADQTVVKKLRNRGGAKYYPCSCYRNHPSSKVYLTRDGTRYHSSVSCSSLKRTVRRVAVSKAGTLRPCSKCG